MTRRLKALTNGAEALRQQIEHLERQQELRRQRTEEAKAAMDSILERRQREIDNLKATYEHRYGTGNLKEAQ
ncbi:hypothetical protein [Mycolicibacterium phlei]|uniref:hypothetical protein n=1 Tax=Mycolicibacterium phlei TaxID=1771 RepID=UPI000590E551|nr:hypothetical protein [Mycolicibacterium phlei]MBF4194640.1 hypothetical protein [Mycolicibacterium phlei]